MRSDVVEMLLRVLEPQVSKRAGAMGGEVVLLAEQVSKMVGEEQFWMQQLIQGRDIALQHGGPEPLFCSIDLSGYLLRSEHGRTIADAFMSGNSWMSNKALAG